MPLAVSRALNAFYRHVLRQWLPCLGRCSQRRSLTWRKIIRLASLAAQREIAAPLALETQANAAESKSRPASGGRHNPRYAFGGSL
jgi:hypothetical protein